MDMNPQILVAIITGVFGAIVAPVVKRLVEVGIPLRDRAEPHRSQLSPRLKTALMTAAGGAIGVFIGYFALAPFVTTPPVASARVTITTPEPEARVGRSVIVQGTATNVQDGRELWVFVLVGGTTQYHPQPGPFPVDASGAWSGSAYIGEDSNDADRQFTLVAALASPDASARIKSYLTDVANKGSYPGLDPLPVGIVPSAQVTVLRQ
jgi:hypothetical protein